MNSLAIGVGVAIGATLSGCGGSVAPAAAKVPSAVVPSASSQASSTVVDDSNWWDKCEKIPTPAFIPNPAPAPPAGGKVPKDGIMVYNGIGNVNAIPDLIPECWSGFCDKNIGTKMPDKCCDPNAWKAAMGGTFKPGEDPFYFGPTDDNPTDQYQDNRFGGDVPNAPNEEATCYIRIAPGPFGGDFNGKTQGAGGNNRQFIRNYLGCETATGGTGEQLYGAENCVPDGLQYVNSSQFAEGKGTFKCDVAGECPWAYPISDNSTALNYHVNGTHANCRCSDQSYYTKGPGCYLAFATLAQFNGMYPAVYVRINGTCS